MLGLRFFACRGCETVHAAMDTPPRCRVCGTTSLDEIGPGRGTMEYFAPSRTH